jgi:hypothetical protein
MKSSMTVEIKYCKGVPCRTQKSEAESSMNSWSLQIIYVAALSISYST